MDVVKQECDQDKEKPLLFVGMACTDFILYYPEYPPEGSFTSAESLTQRRGGNASNSCSALTELKAKCELLTTFGDDHHATYLKTDLKEYGVALSHCTTYEQQPSPITYLVTSLANGSRSGLFFGQNFRDNLYSHFCKVDLRDYCWVHFEGKCPEETTRMLAHIDAWNAKQGADDQLQYSVELEACAEETKLYIPLANVLFVSKDFAIYLGFKDMISAINGIRPHTKAGTVIIVPWGELGATALCANGDIVSSPAYSPPRIVDTIAAGDTFIASTTLYLSKKKSVKEAISFGCKVAGTKCGIDGIKGLSSVLA